VRTSFTLMVLLFIITVPITKLFARGGAEIPGREHDPIYILRAFAQFLAALLLPCWLRGKSRHISINARRFQKGKWEALWIQALRHNNREVANRAKKLEGNRRPSPLPFALDTQNIARARAPC
jgi:hypothetical protein